MTHQQLFNEIIKKQSFLCIGLDTDIKKIPEFLRATKEPIFEFNKRIIDQTHDLTIAYKPNLAFYESQGIEGWKAFERTVHYIKDTYPEILVIADAKRGDIGNTSTMYARTFFQTIPCDAVTVAPYMGADSVKPFLEYKDKWVIILALTSNQGAFDFQFLSASESKLYELVLKKSKEWGSLDQLMYVVGATKAEYFARIRTLVPDHFILVPGIGAQGGNLEHVAKFGMNESCGLIVNSSRGIIYASNSEDFDTLAREKAFELQQQMKDLLKAHQLIS